MSPLGDDDIIEHELRRQQLVNAIRDKLWADDFHCIAIGALNCLANPGTPWQGELPDKVVDPIWEFTDNSKERRFLLALVLTRIVNSITTAVMHELHAETITRK